MAKADLEAHKVEYDKLLAMGKEALATNKVAQALEIALSCLPYVDGMMQYERKYEKREFATVECLEIVLKLAPPLLEDSSLNILESALKEWKRIDRNSEEDYAHRLMQARSVLKDYYQLWDHLERHGEAQQNELSDALGGDQMKWRRAAETWDRMGVIRRTRFGGSYSLRLMTRIADSVRGKCSSCGVVGRAQVAVFWQPVKCPKCECLAVYVILVEQQKGNE